MLYKIQHARSGGVLHGARPGWLKKTSSFSLYYVRITMILCVVYLLQIFKMFHGLMNNPVL